MSLPLHIRKSRLWLVALLAPPALGGALIAALHFQAAAPPGTAPAAAGPDTQEAAPLALPADPGLLVHVSGAVAHPGVYRVKKGERVSAAIDAAGGLTQDADSQRLPNLAGKLKDGEQVKVPSLKGPAGSARAAAVDLNQATPEELMTLPGFTAELVQAVIDYRTQFGGFSSIRELVTVLGMGEADYQTVRKLVRV